MFDAALPAGRETEKISAPNTARSSAKGKRF
jgi:hypothetical protein